MKAWELVVRILASLAGLFFLWVIGVFFLYGVLPSIIAGLIKVYREIMDDVKRRLK